MKGIKNFYLIALLLLSSVIHAQNEVQNTDSSSVDDEYYTELSFMIQSMETMLNLLGDEEISRKDKDQIINQSYLKYFESDKVQIEDDLDPNRVLPINKNVQAYLQDIVFFYKNLEFDFELIELTKGLNDKDQIYYKASLKERLEGVNLYGEPFNEINDRYIEFNIDEAAQEFKMVSIYTTKLSEKEDLATWWNELDYNWRVYFADDIPFKDSLTFAYLLSLKEDFIIGDSIISTDSDTVFVKGDKLYAAIKSIHERKEISILPTDSIKNLAPLHKFLKLEKIDFSSCPIDDVSPLRSLLSLKEINAASSLLTSLNDLQYLSAIEKLTIDELPISDLSVSKNWKELNRLSMKNSPITDLSFLEHLTKLESLNMSGNKSTDYSPLGNITHLVSLDLSSSSFGNLDLINKLVNLHSVNLNETPIKSLEGLDENLTIQIFSIENTAVSDISPLKGIDDLKIIYCDNSAVNQLSAGKFVEERPDVLVIYESKSLFTWWENLNENLKQFIRSRIDSITEPPSTEVLHSIIFTEKADLSGQESINSLEGFEVLINLKELDISSTKVSDLGPISSLEHVRYLDVSHTEIEDLSPLSKITSLQSLNIESTRIQELDSLIDLQNIELIKADQSGLSQDKALDFTLKNGALVLYQSEHLIQWWELLDDEWIRFLSKKMDFNKYPSAKDLQALVNSDTLTIDDFSPQSLDPLLEFKLLRTLEMSRVKGDHLNVLTKIPLLENLQISNVQISDYESLSALTGLKSLDLSTTSTDNLNFLLDYKGLERLNISSTAVESIRSIVLLQNLSHLDISNTRIKKITYLNKLPNLKEVKMTNTLVNEKKINSFKKDHPDVKVIIY